MCRFTVYLGPAIHLGALLVEPSNSLIHQSFHSHERDEPLNGDGFGVAWYKPEQGSIPARFRSLTPAWSNRNLTDLAGVVVSPCILAHVRAATPPSVVSNENCHPFQYGRFSFMHNGSIGGFTRIRRRILNLLSDEVFASIQGTTDTEAMFGLFLDEIEGPEERAGADAIASALERTIRRVVRLVDEHADGEPSYLNVAVSDGRSAVVARFTTDAPEESETLYMSRGRAYACIGGVSRLYESDEAAAAVLVSSEPLTDRSEWDAVPPNHLVVVGEDRHVELRPLQAS